MITLLMFLDKIQSLFHQAGFPFKKERANPRSNDAPGAPEQIQTLEVLIEIAQESSIPATVLSRPGRLYEGIRLPVREPTS